MPSERVFDCIEREIKTKDTIVALEDTMIVLQLIGIVKKLVRDWDDYVWDRLR